MEIFLGLAALVAILYYGYLRFFKTDTTDLKEPAVVADTPVEPAAPVVEAAPEPVAEKAPEPVVEAAPEPVAEVAPEPVAVAQTVAKVKSSTPRAKKKK
jgi:outer membrane biosynthesis protein TonB